MYKKISKTDYNEENIFWITMSDLLLGLMIIFLILFIMSMVGFSQAKVAEQSAQTEMAEKLAKKLVNNKIDVNIDKMSGQVEISDLELFDIGSAKLSAKGKAYLDKFFPIYIDTIFSNSELSDKVENLIIEGHTDSQMFKGLNSADEQYTKMVEITREPLTLLSDITNDVAYFFGKDVEIDPQVQADVLDTETSQEVLKTFVEQAKDWEWTEENLHEKLEQFRGFYKEKGIKPKVTMWAIRAAVTGRTRGADMVGTLVVLGKETSLYRAQKAIK